MNKTDYPPTKIERVAAYVRVSTQEQKLHGLSLDAQKMKLEEFAEKNHMKIVEWYLDEGVSGRKLIKKRPELQRMIQDAEKGEFDRIIFIKLDRFFRSVAEYHECMKRIAPVVWSTTEEEYDLTTANGRMLVNMKLTIAEMEADQTGERIKIVNEYKLSTGQPLTGSQPFGWMIAKDEKTGRKKIVRAPDEEPILRDLLEFYLTNQSKKRAMTYLYAKYHISMTHHTFSNLLSNTMLYGAYKDNPSYCEAYIDPETYNKIQKICERNIKSNTRENRAYKFSGLIRCPDCGNLLVGHIQHNKSGNHKLQYKKYRCRICYNNRSCSFNKVVSENVFEEMMLDKIEGKLAEAKKRSLEVIDSDSTKISKYNIDDIHEEIDRLNYSWQTGKIRKVEQYEARYAELMEELEKAEEEQKHVEVKDFSKIDAILHEGWKAVYAELDDEHRRSFWRSFIQGIYINWTTEKKEIIDVKFF